jgi:hypothetical protein
VAQTTVNALKQIDVEGNQKTDVGTLSSSNKQGNGREHREEEKNVKRVQR